MSAGKRKKKDLDICALSLTGAKLDIKKAFQLLKAHSCEIMPCPNLLEWNEMPLESVLHAVISGDSLGNCTVPWLISLQGKSQTVCQICMKMHACTNAG
jgi:hypothetical protein